MTYSMQSQKLWGVSLLFAALAGCGAASSNDDSASHQPELGAGDESTGASDESTPMPGAASTEDAVPTETEMQTAEVPADPEQETPASSAPTLDDTAPEDREQPQLFESEPPLDAPAGSWALLDIDPVECEPRRDRLGAVASPEDFVSSDATEQAALHHLEMSHTTMFRHPTYTTFSTVEGLEHDVTFAREALDALLAGISVSVISEPGGSLRCPHTHRVTVHACQSNLDP